MTKSKTFEFEATTSNVRYYCSKKVFKTHVTKKTNEKTKPERNSIENSWPRFVKGFFPAAFWKWVEKKHTVRNKLAKGILTVSNE